MKKIFVIFISLITFHVVQCQNLVLNPNFENESHKLRCYSWYDGCGNELTASCDPERFCDIGFTQDAPGSSDTNRWAIIVYATYPWNRYAQTFITEQSGTNIYELNCWYKVNDYYWYGKISIGRIVNKEFILSKSVKGSNDDWTRLSLKDTITTMENDTIAVRLSAGICDFCAYWAYFDQIELIKTGTIVSNNYVLDNISNKITVYPNPSLDFVKIKLPDSQNEKKRLSIYDVMGNCVKVIESTERIIYIYKTDLYPGIFNLIVHSVSDERKIGQGKFIMQ